MSANETSAFRQVAVVTRVDGFHFSADVRGHQIDVDQPAAAGGTDEGPMPLEMFAVALSSCVALYVAQFCDTRRLPSTGFEVAVAMRTTRNPYRIGALETTVTLPPDFPEEYVGMVQRAAMSCPAHHTLAHPPELTFRVVTPVGEAGAAQLW
jgi:putative redox protein